MDYIFGRDELIDRIWKRLETGSIRFTAERRIGKTTVMKEMLAEPRDGFRPIFLDLEKVDSPQRFVEVLLTEMQPWFTKQQIRRQWFQKTLEALGGIEIAGVVKFRDFSAGWQTHLEKMLGGLLGHLAKSQTDSKNKVVFLFDELPYMLQKIAVAEPLKFLSQDHYLKSDLDDQVRKRYSFRFPLIQRWWVISRGLQP